MANVLEDLLEALEDVDDATREEAAKTLADLGDPATLDALIGACNDDFWSVRAHAGCGVAKIGGPKAVEALIGLFNDSIMEVRDQAVEATAKMGPIVLDRLVTAMKDERWRVREHAAKAAGKIKDSRAVDALIGRLSRPGRSRQERSGGGAWAKSPTRKPFHPLIKMFRDSSKIVRETAGTALVYMGHPQSIR